MKEINNGYFTGERSLFNSEDIKINNTIFGEGESPLKESDNIELNNSRIRHNHIRQCNILTSSKILRSFN